MEFDDCVQSFRDKENHEDALVLLMDRPLLKMAGLWRSSVIKRVNSYVFDSDWHPPDTTVPQPMGHSLCRWFGDTTLLSSMRFGLYC